MRYEPHRLRVALEKLERPFDTKFNNALKEILLVIDPFEELEKWVAELAERVEKLEDELERQSAKEISPAEEVS